MKANGTVKKEAAPQQTAPPATQLTEIERLKLENLMLRYNALQQQMNQILVERSTLLRQIETDRPGYRWDEQKGLVLAEGDRL